MRKFVVIFCILVLLLNNGCASKKRKKVFLHQSWSNYDASPLGKSSTKYSSSKKSTNNIAERRMASTKNLAEKKTIIIAGSKPKTTKFNLAGWICQDINNLPNTKFNCLVAPTKGVANALDNSNKYDFIISQGNIEKKLKFQRNNKLHSVFSLYPEVFTMLVSKNSGIKNIADVKGKKVYLGSKNSASRIAFSRVLRSEKLSLKDVKEVADIDLAKAICESKIDVIFNGLYHPDTDIDKLIDDCGVKIIPMNSKYIQQLIKQNDEYLHVKIYGGAYNEYEKDVDSFGVMVNLLATEKIQNDDVYDFVRLIYQDMQKFKIGDPALLEVEPNKMAIMNSGLVLPIHPGALKYYKEKNIQNYE